MPKPAVNPSARQRSSNPESRRRLVCVSSLSTTLAAHRSAARRPSTAPPNDHAFESNRRENCRTGPMGSGSTNPCSTAATILRPGSRSDAFSEAPRHRASTPTHVPPPQGLQPMPPDGPAVSSRCADAPRVKRGATSVPTQSFH